MPENSHRMGAHSPEYALLGFLYEQPNHGYNLHRLLVTELGYIWHAKQSQTYSILKRLKTQGNITSTTQAQDKLPPRQLLQITEAGRHRFEAWLNESSGSSVRTIRLEFITRLYFATRLFPGKVALLLDTQSAEINTTLARLEAFLRVVPYEQTCNRLSLELRIQQMQSAQDWLGMCRKTLAADTKKSAS